ncbi:MAG TPA: hypothetical protein VD902_18525 [Symbiobacteriaceae bacterium]|nr:hypothetical protein [Symbiobacteriaceae bacterium]
MNRRLALALTGAAVLAAVGTTAAFAAARPVPRREPQATLQAGGAPGLPGNDRALKQALQVQSPVTYRVMRVDEAVAPGDRTARLERVAAEWGVPAGNELYLVVFAQDNYDVRFYMGPTFGERGVTVEEMLALVRWHYHPRAQAADPAGALADLMAAVTARMSLPCAESTAPGAEEGALRSVVTRYFEALAQGDVAGVNELVTDGMKLGEEGTPVRSAAITGLRFDRFICVEGRQKAVLRVNADLVVEGASPWNHGANTRWAVLVKEPGGWKVEALTTSPLIP